MKFFLEFLKNYTAKQILQMYASSVFVTADEIKIADLTVNLKIIFADEPILPEDKAVYWHLQKVVDAIRMHEQYRELNLTPTDELFRYFSEDTIHFHYFVKYGEHEREISRLNIIERRIIFAFKPKEEGVSDFDWLKVSLNLVTFYNNLDGQLLVKYLHN